MHAGLKVALADDDPLIQRSLTSLLLRSGHDVVAASDGAELVEVCQSQAVDLIITDISMPRMDGLEAVEKIYERWRCGHHYFRNARAGLYRSRAIDARV